MLLNQDAWGNGVSSGQLRYFGQTRLVCDVLRIKCYGRARAKTARRALVNDSDGLVGECGDVVFNSFADGYHNVLTYVPLPDLVKFHDSKRTLVAASGVEFSDVTDDDVVLVL